MFIPTLKNQTTDEQKKLFLEPALKHHIIGCYAQTEVRFHKVEWELGKLERKERIRFIDNCFFLIINFRLATVPTFRVWKLLLLISTKLMNSKFIHPP